MKWAKTAFGAWALTHFRGMSQSRRSTSLIAIHCWQILTLANAIVFTSAA